MGRDPFGSREGSRLIVRSVAEAEIEKEGVSMTTKERVQEVLDRLPDDCSLEDVLYDVYVLQAIDRGMADAEAGRTIPHEEVAEELRRKWVLGAAG